MCNLYWESKQDKHTLCVNVTILNSSWKKYLEQRCAVMQIITFCGGGVGKNLWDGIPVVSKGSWERNTDAEMKNILLKLNEL